GLLHAIRRFDASRGVPFGAFAMPTIMGELRRHFRDHTWMLHVPRREKDLLGLIDAVGERLESRQLRPPSAHELAMHLSMGEDRVVEILAAGAARRTMPLDSVRAGAQRPPADDGTRPQDEVLDRLELHELLDVLSERSRRVVELRYFDQLTQREIANVLGLSQVHVGRLLAAGLATLRSDTRSRRDGAA
ncbi:MAG TPA: sigma-70 family RNA polymerase sigma factor, partial [Microthrixaceae bacterium]|nr:sigma-70 family RNA polymerase sigma factor [Microthrixaceae bacterium]